MIPFIITDICIQLAGVINPQSISQYHTILGMDEYLGDAPEILEGFFNTCALAGGSICALAALYPTADKIKDAFNQYLDKVYKTWTLPQTNSYNAIIHNQVLSVLYNPSLWYSSAIGLAQDIALNQTKVKGEEVGHHWHPIRPFYSRPMWNARVKSNLEKRQDFNEVYGGYLWENDYNHVAILYVPPLSDTRLISVVLVDEC
jgi:hypothetical protein